MQVNTNQLEEQNLRFDYDAVNVTVAASNADQSLISSLGFRPYAEK